jgi:uncharacterized membrane-anchored protein YitT (DUF2179 family)
MELSQHHALGTTIVKVISFIVVNITLMAIFNYLTIDSFANMNSRIGSIILSFFLPFFIVYVTRKMPALERLVKFGTGFVLDIILITIIAGFPEGITSGLIPCLTIALGVLYYGGRLLNAAE